MRRFLAQTVAPASRSRRTAAVLGGVAVAALASGCMVFNPIQTDVPYEPADGISAEVGDLAIRDLLLVGGGGEAAVVAGAVINLGDEPIRVQVVPQEQAASGGGSEVEVGPRQQVNLADEGLQLEGLAAKPGTIVPVAVTAQPGGTTIVDVPVLAPTGPYATLTPAPAGPRPATATPTATATETTTPTETPTGSSTETPTPSPTTS